jgi:hypothetical protein
MNVLFIRSAFDLALMGDWKLWWIWETRVQRGVKDGVIWGLHFLLGNSIVSCSVSCCCSHNFLKSPFIICRMLSPRDSCTQMNQEVPVVRWRCSELVCGYGSISVIGCLSVSRALGASYYRPIFLQVNIFVHCFLEKERLENICWDS